MKSKTPIATVRADAKRGLTLEELERHARHGAHLIKMAKSLGWIEDSGEGPYEYICRVHYCQGLEDGR